MPMPRTPRQPLTTLSVLTTLLISIPVLACGPDFPLQLLSDRGQHLQQLPEPLFATEVLALATKIPNFPLPAKSFASQYDWQLNHKSAQPNKPSNSCCPPSKRLWLP